METDKAWEGSKTPKVVVALSTYVAIGVFLIVIRRDNPWINAIVPTIGFMLSTLTLPFIKTWWGKNIYEN